jgi:hypothetical protein
MIDRAAVNRARTNVTDKNLKAKGFTGAFKKEDVSVIVDAHMPTHIISSLAEIPALLRSVIHTYA